MQVSYKHLSEVRKVHEQNGFKCFYQRGLYGCDEPMAACILCIYWVGIAVVSRAIYYDYDCMISEVRSVQSPDHITYYKQKIRKARAHPDTATDANWWVWSGYW